MRNEVREKAEIVMRLAQDEKKYIDVVKSTYILEEKIAHVLIESGYKFNLYQTDDSPEIRMFLDFGEYVHQNFHITYEYHLYLSKYCNVYKDYFRYEVKNFDPEEITGGVVVGDKLEPLTKSQYDFYTKLVYTFDTLGYVHLFPRDYEEVLMDMMFPDESMKFLNEQPNVDLLFFNDLFGFIED